MSNRQIFLLTGICAILAFLGAYIQTECFYASQGVEFKKQLLIDSGLANESSNFLNQNIVFFKAFLA